MRGDADATRSTRSRPAKPPLSRDAILTAALEILRAEGLDALNMRRVAGALDTGAASLYVYFSNRDELQAELFDRVVGEVRLEEPDPARWREQLKAIAHEMVRVMDEHPGIARVPIASVPTGPNAMAVSDVMIALLRAGGLSDRVTAFACDLLPMYVVAVAFENSIYAAKGVDAASEAAIIDDIRQAFAALPAERYPNIVALGPALTAGDGAERFEFGLDVLIDGLLAQPD